MNGRLTQPKVDGYIQWMRRNDPFGMTDQCYDAESCKLLDEFFALLRQIAPISQNGAKILWLRAERGPIEDFGSIEDEIAEGNYETEDEFITEWKSWFPDEIKWYQLQAWRMKQQDTGPSCSDTAMLSFRTSAENRQDTLWRFQSLCTG